MIVALLEDNRYVRLRDVSLREASQNLMADATSQSGREMESVMLLSNSYQTPSHLSVDKKSHLISRRLHSRRTVSHANVRDCNKASNPEIADAKKRTNVEI